MFPTFPSPNNCFYPVAHNSSYGDYTKIYDNAKKLTFNYGDVFKEFTNADMKIACSDEQLCYVGCECKTANGWSGGSTMSANGTLSTASAGGELNSDYTIKDDGAAKKTTSSATPGISTMAVGGSCTISVTDPRYGLTCRKASTYDCNNVCGGSAYYYCPAGEVGKTCSDGYYRVSEGTQKCSAGSGRSSKTCYSCKPCNWTCQSGYYTSASGDYKLTTTSTPKVCDGDTSQKHSSQKCYTRTLKGCTDYNSSYKTSVPSGQTCDPVNPRSGLTCYTNCKKDVTCEDGNYYTTCPSGMRCLTVKYEGLTCYKKAPQLVIQNDPCNERCNVDSDNPYYKVIGINKCCCPSSSTTDSKKCECCAATTDPCGCEARGLQYYQYANGANACCGKDVAIRPGCPSPNSQDPECPTSCFICDPLSGRL